MQQESLAEGLVNWSSETDATEVSKCNHGIRNYYERKSKIACGVAVKQLDVVEDLFEVKIQTSILYWNCERLPRNMNEIKKLLKGLQPTSVDFEMTASSVAEILTDLGAEWFDHSNSISITCREEATAQNENVAGNTSHILKREIGNILRRFDILDNIIFRPGEIWTKSYERMQMLCCWLCNEQLQRRSLRIKHAQIGITAVDIKNILKNANLSRDFHLRRDIHDDAEGRLTDEFLRLFTQRKQNTEIFSFGDRTIYLIQHHDLFYTAEPFLFCIVYLFAILLWIFFKLIGEKEEVPLGYILCIIVVEYVAWTIFNRCRTHYF